ncbi:MAG: glycoside hydrolase family 38 C-terminal domain-containing protein [Planctomycetota bacterium]
MLPDTHFHQFILPRLVQGRARLASLIWRDATPPLPVMQTPPTAAHRTLQDVAEDEFKPVPETPFHWGTMFDQCWWRLKLPEDAAGRYLLWRDEGEATVYANGVPVYGIDPGHHYAPIPDGVTELTVESLCARTGVWVDNAEQGIDDTKGSHFRGAVLADRNEDAWHAWHDLDVLMQVMELLEKPEYLERHGMWGKGGYRPELTEADPLLRRLIHRTNQAMDAFDAEGVAACRSALSEIYQDFPAAPDEMTALLTGHAHIDLVWLWPERAGEFKAVHSFANALSMIERYPEVVFGYSQPASYEAVAQRSPTLMQRVGDAIKTGHWEPTGALYVESDVQLPCGEALVRAFALGQQGFRELQGRDSQCVWIPDVFGYSACLPTIMAGFDVPYFYTTKLHWSGATRFPYSSFRWVGMDGSEAVSHISWHHYNQAIKPNELKNAAYRHRQSHVHGEALFPCGYGDGGGGLNESMCERARRLSNLASMPRAQWGTIEGFFDRLNTTRDTLPAWRGEMYLEYHRGVQTTNGPLKSAFRAAERSLQVHEAVRCATGGGPVDQTAWKRVCFAQFHDYIPGSSIAEVYEEHIPELEGIAQSVLEQAQAELDATASDAEGDPQDCVFNPLAMPRRELIDGQVVELPPLTGVTVADLQPIETEPVQATTETLSNGRVDARFTPAGELAALAVDGHAVALAAPGAQVLTFEDVPAVYDAWDIDRYALSQSEHHNEPAEARVDLDAGVGRVAFERALPGVGRITLTYTLEPGSPVLGIDIDLELTKPQCLVKLAFPTGYTGREARYGGPFGSVRRPQWPGPLANEAMFENPGSRWACVADDDERDGLMLVTEAKYGFGAVEGLLHVSLARSAKYTAANKRGGTTTLETDKHGNFCDLGHHHIRLAVGRFSAQAPRAEQPAALTDLLYTPCLRYTGQPVSAGMLSLEAPASLVPAWAVPGDNGNWTLRLHETLGSRGPLGIRLAEGLTAQHVDLRDLPVDAPLDTVSPYQLRSLRIDNTPGR